MRQPCTGNLNNLGTIANYVKGLRFIPFKPGKQNPDFEQGLRKALPGIAFCELLDLRAQLKKMSESAQITGQIKIRPNHYPLAKLRPYVQHGNGEVSSIITKRVEAFQEEHSLESFGYGGG
jgi:hypothetical protein